MSEMKRKALIDALTETERFIRAGKKALKSFDRSQWESGSYWQYDMSLHAAAKRASMDATRALARFRRGGRER